MLVKLKDAKESVQKTTKPKRTRTRTCVCNKCHKEQTYIEQTIPIQYGLNCKQSVLINGIERVCSVCGWHVDDVEVSKINQKIARDILQG